MESEEFRMDLVESDFQANFRDFRALRLRPITFFFASIAFYFAYIFLTQPGWWTSGEMWAEMSTNYFANANSGSFRQAIFSLDAGYWPLLLRIISYLLVHVGVSASSMPIAMNAVAILGTALLVGVFCLAWFRLLIKSDLLRFVVVVGLLMVIDFETRTFINWTYFAGFTITIMAAAVWALEPDTKLPSWYWVAPFFMFTKPAVIATIPFVLFIAVVSKNKAFRPIAIVTLIAAGIQAAVLYVSSLNGQVPVAHQPIVSMPRRLLSGAQYAAENLAAFIAPGSFISFTTGIIVGAVISIAVVGTYVRFKTGSLKLAVAGLALIASNSLLNSIALPLIWGQITDLTPTTPAIVRAKILTFTGVVLLVAGLIGFLFFDQSFHFMSKIQFRYLSYVASAAFVSWFVLAGWLSQAHMLSSRSFVSSAWQSSSGSVIPSGTPGCIPTDPLGWTYVQGGCEIIVTSLGNNLSWGATYDFALASTGSHYEFEIGDPTDLYGFSIFVRPAGGTTQELTGTVSFSDGAGNLNSITSSTKCAVTGCLVYFRSLQPIPVMSGNLRVQFAFQGPVLVASSPAHNDVIALDIYGKRRPK